MADMRRAGLSWVLSLLLVLAQHGAVLHELAHLSQNPHTQGTALRAHAQPLDQGVCFTCEAFAQVTNPASSAAVSQPVCPATFLPTSDPCFRIVGVDTPTPRSRGPPQV